MGKPLVIPFFIPHAGCPFTCVFCNQWGITGETASADPAGMEEKVRAYQKTVPGTPQFVEVAFFGGSFTGLPEEIQLSWLIAAHDLVKRGLINGTRLSTRPDYINEKNLLMLRKYGVTTIELGVQSLVDEVLTVSRRGYTANQVLEAVELIREYPFKLVLQLMLGLPGDNRETAWITAQKTVSLRPDYLRVYPTVVMKDTLLENWYQEGRYVPWSLEQAVETAADWLGLFSFYGIPVIRMGLQATANLQYGQELVAGPYHPAFGELVESALMRQHLETMLAKIAESTEMNEPAELNNPVDLNEPAFLNIFFNPLDYSKVVGQKRSNIQALQKRYKFGQLCLKPDQRMPCGDLHIRMDAQDLLMTRQEYLQRYRI